MKGLTLYELLYASLDLPEEIKSKQLAKLLEENGLTEDNLTLDSLRDMVADLLHNLILESDQEQDQIQQ